KDLGRVLQKQEYQEAIWSILIWEVYDPAAKELYDRAAYPGYHIERVSDQTLTAFSLAIIRARPWSYASWLAKGFGFAVLMTLVNNYLFLALMVLLGGVLSIRPVLCICQGRRAGPAPPEGSVRLPRHGSYEFNLLILIAAGFALSRILLIIVVAVPIYR